ncbi:hypothetical protein KY285_020288 [Solanum tuberosum]|nr:hypothetical protein KY285_020288 [Solanum tuberosum]
MVVPATTSDTAIAVPTTTHVVQFNPVAQSPTKLQGNLNFATWMAKLVMLLNGHKLLGHLSSAKSAPPTTITHIDSTISNPEYEIWFFQDQLIQQAMMASVDPTIAPTIATAFSANNSMGSPSYSEIRSIVDALKVAGSSVADDELAVKILSGLGHEYREITAAIRARHTTVSFEELFQKLTDHELFLKHQDIDRSSSIITTAVAQRINFQPQHQKNNRLFPNQYSKPQAP